MSRSIFSPTNRFPVLLACLIVAFLAGVGFDTTSLPHPPDAEFSDATISRYPDALHFQRAIQEAQTLPLWNSHLMGGQPFAANPGTKVWYPLTWLLMLWPPEWHINFIVGFHLWLGGVGMWVWSRKAGMMPLAAALAGTAYALAPKLVAHGAAGHTDILIAMGWTPWLLYSIHALLRERITAPKIVSFGCVSAMIGLGAVQLLPYIVGLAILYTAILIWESSRIRHLADLQPFLLGIALAIGLTAVMWVPLIDLGDTISRGDITQQDAALFSLEPLSFLGMLIGNHGGGAEQMTYVGVSIAILALAGLLMRPRSQRGWWLIIVGVSLYALGENFFLWTALTDLIPPLLWFRVPSRAWLLMSLLLPYLAGWGLHYLAESPPIDRTARLGIFALLSFGLLCSGFSQISLGQSDIPTTALLGLWFVPVTALLLALAIFRSVSIQRVVLLLVVIAVLDLLWIDVTLIEGRDRTEWLQETPPHTIAHLQATGARIYTPDYAIGQQNTAYWGIARFDGVDPFQMQPFVEMAETATGVRREGYSTTVPATVVLTADEASQAPLDTRLLAAWGVEWVVTREEISQENLLLEAQERGLFFYKNQDYRWGNDMVLDWQSPNAFRVRPSTPPIAVSLMSAWQASPDEATGKTRFDYTSQSVVIGLIISILTIFVIGLWLMWGYCFNA